MILRKRINEAMKNTPNGVSFINIDYVNQDSERSHYTVNVGASYENAIQKDIAFLKELNVNDLKPKKDITFELLEQARQILLERLINPNEKTKKLSKAQQNTYTHLCNGIKIHKETNDLFIYGFKVNKKTVKKGLHKEDKRKPLTKSKDLIRSLLKHTKYRQFKFHENQVAGLSVGGDRITFKIH